MRSIQFGASAHRRIGASALLALVSLAASAQVSGPGAWVPSQNGTTGQSDPMPHYFTGTGAYAMGEAACPGLVNGQANYLTTMVLRINGFPVKFYVHTPGEPQTTRQGLVAVFDSTHFAPWSTVTVSVEANDLAGNRYEASGSSVVRNNARGFNKHAFAWSWGGNGTMQFMSHVDGPHYDAEIVWEPGWNADDVADALASAGVYYINSHGQSESEEMDDPDSGPLGTLWSNSASAPDPPITPHYEDFRQMHNGVGFPPYNSSGNPPVHFAMLDCCKNFADPWPRPTDFREILYPHLDYWASYQRNQAVYGWRHYGRLLTTENHVWWIIGGMMAGKTVNRARLDLVNAQIAGHVRNVDQSLTGGPWDWTRVKNVQDLRIIGDRFTRIRTVYTGSDLSISTGWYR